MFDPFPYGLLTMVVSLEAIFLSTFILISQNHEEHLAQRAGMQVPTYLEDFEGELGVRLHGRE